MRKRIFTLLMALCSIAAMEAQVRYVTENGEGDGTSWENASGDIQAMIDELDEAGGGEVWVAAGTYVPTVKLAEFDSKEIATTNRDKSFRLRKNVKVYGGFPAEGNSTWKQRDSETNITILSGDLGADEFAYHVVVSIGDVGTAILDGFHVVDGLALATLENPNGVGSSDPILNELSVDGINASRRQGAGLFVYRSSPILRNLKIYNNTSYGLGSALKGLYSGAELSNSIIEKNTSYGQGTMQIGFCENFKLINLTIRENTATGIGLFLQHEGSVTLENVVIEDNIQTATSSDYAGLYIKGAAADKPITVTLKNVYVKGHESPSNAGASFIFLSEASSIDGLYCIGNTAKAATTGGLYLYQSNNISLSNIVVEDNKGINGPVYVVECKNIIFNYLTAKKNRSTRGGGIHLQKSSNIKIYNAEITNNIVEKNGSAIYTDGVTVSNVKGENLLIANNEVTSPESNAYVVRDIDLTNTTIVDNHFSSTIGTAILYNSTNLFQNSIIWGNTNSNGITNAGNTLVVKNALIEGKDLSAEGGFDASNILTEQIFKNFNEGDYTLLPWRTNPAIDKGDNSFLDATILKDISGNSRFEGTVDLGAYEAQNVYNPFTGGTINEVGEREFTYTGSPVALTFHANTGATTADYTWTETSGTNETGTSGLPVEAGEYTITAKLADGTYPGAVSQTEIKISKAELPITFDAISDMIVSVTPPQTLSATNTAGLTLEYESSDPSVASVSGSSLTAEGAGTAEITVRLASYDRNYYATPVVRNVHVQGPEVADASLLGIRVDGKDAVKNENGEYVINVASSVTSVNIEAIASSSLAATDGDINTQSVLPGENEFTISVNPQTGSAAEYKLHVYVQNGDASVAALAVNGKQATEESPGIYTISVTYTTEATVVVTPTDDLATVGGITTTQLAVRKGENIQHFTITAEDGTKATYQLTINVLNNNAYMSGITVDGTAATEDGMNYSITIANTTSTDIVVTSLDPNAMVNGQQGIQAVTPGNNTFTYTVTSEDGEVENTYTLTVYVSKNDASINSVLVGGRPAAFNSSTNTYTVILPQGTTTTEIVVTPNDANATVSGQGTKTVTTGENTFNIRVTAEDGTEISYTVIIKVSSTSIVEPDPEDPKTPDTPDPNPDRPLISITGSLPEGVMIEPGIGTHTLSRGDTLTLTIRLGDQYDDMRAYLVIDGDTVELQQVLRATSYTYTLNNITKNMTIEVVIKDKDGNQVVSNAVIGDGSRIWTAPGAVYIRTDKPDRVFVYSLQGKLVAEQRLAEGETKIGLPEGLYVVVLKNMAEKIIVRE